MESSDNYGIDSYLAQAVDVDDYWEAYEDMTINRHEGDITRHAVGLASFYFEPEALAEER